MRGAFKIISVRGINLFLHWTFLLLILWVMLANGQNPANIDQLAWSMLFMFGLLVSVILHESGHAITAMEYGIQAKNIVLLPFGGIASLEKFPSNPRQELLISLSGPLVNLIIAGVLKILFPLQTTIPDDYAQISIAHPHDFILNLYLANIALAIFNLIPAFPLDGGRIIRALLAFRLNYIRATSVATIIGKVMAALLFAGGIFMYSPVLAIAGLFVIFAEDTEEYYLRIRSLVKNIKVNDVTMLDYSSLEHDLTVLEASEILLHNHSKYFIVMENDKPVGSVNRMKIITAVAERKYDATIKDLEKEEIETLDGEQPVDLVLEKLAVDEDKIYPVIEKGYFSGVVSLNHIIEYLLLQKANTEDYKRVKSLSVLLH